MGAVWTATVVFALLVCVQVAANSSDDANENAFDQVESGGSQRTNSGRSFVILKHSRQRAFGSKIFAGNNGTEEAQETFRRRDLHTAYRLPLQRLSNQQLKMLVKKYTKNGTTEYPEIINGVEGRTRAELLENLQEMILQKSATKEGRKLMRPKLISSALLPTNEVHAMGIPIVNKKSQQRTTLSTFQMTTAAPLQNGLNNDESAIRRSSKSSHVSSVSVVGSTEAKTVRTIQVDEFPVADGEAKGARQHHSYAEHVISKGNANSKQYLRELTDMLRKVKAKYEHIRKEYLRKIKRGKKTSPVVEKSGQHHEAIAKPVEAERWEYHAPHSASVKAAKTHISEEVIIPEPTAPPTLEETTIENSVTEEPVTAPVTNPTTTSTTATTSTTTTTTETTTFATTEQVASTEQSTVDRAPFMPVLNKTLIVQQLRKLAALSREYRLNQTKTDEAVTSAPTEPVGDATDPVEEQHSGTVEVLEVHDGEASHFEKSDEKLAKTRVLDEQETSTTTRRPAPKAKAIVMNGERYRPQKVRVVFPTRDQSTSKESREEETENGKKRNEFEMHDGETKGVNAKIFISPRNMAMASGNHQAPIKVTMKKVSELTRDSDVTVDELVNDLQKELVDSQMSTAENMDSQMSTTENPLAEMEKNLEAFAQFDDSEVCDSIACDFENGTLCNWVSSIDELSPSSPHYLYLRKSRSTHFIRRSWYNWIGRYRNRVTGIARAQVFSHSNQRFAAAYVRPKQHATLSANLLSGEQETLRFRAWEATRDVQLRVCCDSTQNCVFETERGVKRGTRRWIDHTATCPQGTKKVIFECINLGIFQGACGIDHVHLVNDYCPSLLPQNVVHDGGARRHL